MPRPCAGAPTRFGVFMRLCAVLLISFLWTPIRAANLADPIATARAEIEASCGTVEYLPEWLQYADLTGDGLDDLVITYAVRCDGAYSFFCGTAGCSGGVFVQTPDGHWHDTGLPLNVSRTEWQDRVAISLWMHGSACGRDGTDPRISTRVWNGTAFEIVEKNY